MKLAMPTKRSQVRVELIDGGGTVTDEQGQRDTGYHKAKTRSPWLRLAWLDTQRHGCTIFVTLSYGGKVGVVAVGRPPKP